VSLGLTLSVAYEALVKELRLEIEAKDEEISRLSEAYLQAQLHSRDTGGHRRCQATTCGAFVRI
jgi:hypothetical protein